MPRVTLHPGERFASEYEVISKLGEGGFGSVWRVRQESTGHERALKILHPEVLIDPASLKRFYEEAKVGARIASEHIVEVHSAGVDQ
ncbi:MAG: serine/threonine protein kinase, partial [Myxococcales bacterium]|nr:serine/threonine protein kinase [Myxococcales bacterium]